MPIEKYSKNINKSWKFDSDALCCEQFSMNGVYFEKQRSDNSKTWFAPHYVMIAVIFMQF